MRRLVLALIGLIAAAIALPPLWFTLFPPEVPELAPPSNYVTLASGARMHFIEQGEGPAVVLVHGLPGQAGDWRETTALLAALGRRVIAIDRIGYGHSSARSDDDFSYEANARELRELLDALELSDVTVVGWSYGGGTALTAAHQQLMSAGAPRIGRIALVGSPGPAPEPAQPPLLMRVLFSGPVLRWAHRVPPLARRMQRAISADAFSGQPQPDWWLPGLAANLAQEKTAAAFVGEAVREATDPVPGTADLSLSILVVQGDDDHLVPIAIGRALARDNQAAELLEVAGGSHMLPVTHAALLADRIASFSAPPPTAEPAAPPGADVGAPETKPEHWMDVLALHSVVDRGV